MRQITGLIFLMAAMLGFILHKDWPSIQALALLAIAFFVWKISDKKS